MTLNWKPKSTRPDRKWSSDTLILETQRYVQARNRSLNPPMQPDPAPRRSPTLMQGAVRQMKSVLLLLKVNPAERRRKTRPEAVLALFLTGVAVLFLDVVSLRDAPDTTFFLSFLFGVILIAQSLRLFVKIRW